MQLTLTYQLTEEDYFEFSYFTTWTAIGNKRKRIIYYTKVLLLSFGVVLLFYLFGNKITPTFIIPYTVVLLLYVFLLLPARIKSNYKRRAKKIFEDTGNSALFSKAMVEIGDSEIVTQDENSKTQLKWSSIISYAENEKYYFLYLSKVSAIIIPKRIFRSKEEENTLKTLLERNIDLSVKLESLKKGTAD